MFPIALGAGIGAVAAAAAANSTGGSRTRSQAMEPTTTSQTASVTSATSTTARALGLKNATGEQNCFLNVVIQALWRQRSCREFFLSVGDPWRSNNPVLISLTALMTEYSYSDEQILPPDQVRHALAEVYAGLNRFQLGRMDDAAESFQAILTAIHSGSDEEMTEISAIDRPCKDREICLGHQVFALDYVKMDRCSRCGIQKQDGFGTMFSLDLYAQEVIELVQVMGANDNGPRSSPARLSSIIRELEAQKRKPCQDCHAPSTVCSDTILLSLPKVFCMNIVWPQADPDRSMLSEMLRIVQASLPGLKLGNAFRMPPEGLYSNPMYDLTGMICFYPGGHYVFFGLVGSSGNWRIFDDHEIKQVGSFEKVVDRCERAKYQPVCLFFEKRLQVPEVVRSSVTLEAPRRSPPPPPPPVSTARWSQEGVVLGRSQRFAEPIIPADAESQPPPAYADVRRQSAAPSPPLSPPSVTDSRRVTVPLDDEDDPSQQRQSVGRALLEAAYGLPFGALGSTHTSSSIARTSRRG